MRAVVQRVLEAEVKLVLSEVEGIQNQSVGRIGSGLLVYLSVGKTDAEKDAEWIAEKLVNLRIFHDEAGKMNRSILDVQGGILLVSNFTLHGDCRKGRRPSFDAAAEPQLAQQLYEKVLELVKEQRIPVETGTFGEYMQVSSINDGPVNFLLDSTKLF
jgi:D-tyrosyl-tRNA(Tyr) deacylase